VKLPHVQREADLELAKILVVRKLDGQSSMRIFIVILCTSMEASGPWDRSPLAAAGVPAAPLRTS